MNTLQRVLAAILLQQTMERAMDDLPTPRYLCGRKRVVPFLRVDPGLADEEHHVQLTKPIVTSDELLDGRTGTGSSAPRCDR